LSRGGWKANGRSRFGARLADGEAEAAALAAVRGYILATDDRKARRVATERCSTLRLTGTLELLREWQSTAGIVDAVIASALRRIAERATYRPRRTDPLWSWWATRVSP
jgi:predicted nucleic acid-binding protein